MRSHIPIVLIRWLCDDTPGESVLAKLKIWWGRIQSASAFGLSSPVDALLPLVWLGILGLLVLERLVQVRVDRIL